MKQSKRSSNRYQVFTTKRHYKYDVTLDDKPSFNLNENDWKKLVLSELQSIQQLEYVAVIFHDKDTNENDELVGLHAHIVAKYKNLKKYNIAQSELNPYSTNDLDFNFATSEGGSIRYLTHTSEKSMIDQKYPYSPTEIKLFIDNELQSKTDTIKWYTAQRSLDFEATETKKQKLQHNANLKINEIKTQVANGQIFPIDARKILISEFPDDVNFANSLYTAKLKNELDHYRNTYIEEKTQELLATKQPSILSNIYITGSGGSGKTTFARNFAHYICQNENVDTRSIFNANASTEQTNTLFSNYQFEHVSIFNEISYALKQQQFCEMFDTYETKPVLSRFRNTVNTSRYCIFTKSDDFETWTNKIGINGILKTSDTNDKIWQVQRRFDVIVEINDNNLLIKTIEDFNTTRTVKDFPIPTIQQLTNPDKTVNKIFDTIIKYCQK